MQLFPEMHRGIFDNRTSTVALPETAPAGIHPLVTYAADRVPIAGIGSYFRELRACKGMSQKSAEAGGSYVNAFVYAENNYSQPLISNANRMFQGLGGKILLYAISTPTFGRPQTELALVAPDDEEKLISWFVSECQGHSRGTLNALLQNASIRKDALQHLETTSHKRPRTIEKLFSAVLGKTVEYCAVHAEPVWRAEDVYI